MTASENFSWKFPKMNCINQKSARQFFLRLTLVLMASWSASFWLSRLATSSSAAVFFVSVWALSASNEAFSASALAVSASDLAWFASALALSASDLAWSAFSSTAFSFSSSSSFSRLVNRGIYYAPKKIFIILNYEPWVYFFVRDVTIIVGIAKH